MKTVLVIVLLAVWRVASSAPVVSDPDYNISLVASGLVSATGMAISPTGDIFVTDYRDSGPSSILRIDKTTGTVQTYATGFSFATDLAFDTSGRLFVLSQTGGGLKNVYEVFSDGTYNLYRSGFSASIGLEPTLDGGLLVGNSGNGTISAISSAGAVSTYLSGFGGPNGIFGVAQGATGNTYFVQHGTGGVYMSTPALSVSLLATLSPFGPTFLDVDSSGSVYVADSLNGSIFKISGGTVTTFASGFTGKANPPMIGPGDLEFDSFGNLYIADADSLWKISPVSVIPELITIDIKPGSDPNSINLCSNGAVPVAILGSDTFDVSTVNTESLRFAGAGVKVVGKKDPRTLCSLEDVNGDSYLDVVCHFVMADIAAIDGESGIAKVNGELLDGKPIEGTDSVNIVKDLCIPFVGG